MPAFQPFPALWAALGDAFIGERSFGVFFEASRLLATEGTSAARAYLNQAGHGEEPKPRWTDRPLMTEAHRAALFEEHDKAMAESAARAEAKRKALPPMKGSDQ